MGKGQTNRATTRAVFHVQPSTVRSSKVSLRLGLLLNSKMLPPLT